MISIEITFFIDHAMIIKQSERGLTIRQMKLAQALNWMKKQELKWTWINLPNGEEVAVWERD